LRRAHGSEREQCQSEQWKNGDYEASAKHGRPLWGMSVAKKRAEGKKI
jgi:hypothetical protein